MFAGLSGALDEATAAALAVNLPLLEHLHLLDTNFTVSDVSRRRLPPFLEVSPHLPSSTLPEGTPSCGAWCYAQRHWIVTPHTYHTCCVYAVTSANCPGGGQVPYCGQRPSAPVPQCASSRSVA